MNDKVRARHDFRRSPQIITLQSEDLIELQSAFRGLPDNAQSHLPQQMQLALQHSAADFACTISLGSHAEIRHIPRMILSTPVSPAITTSDGSAQIFADQKAGSSCVAFNTYPQQP